jgi:sec-independent protein translocase protein TatB
VLDIGFGEIVLIFGLALVVLGPEKLPRVAAQVGRWIGRARGMARQFREQLEEEVNFEEARKARPPAITPTPAAAIPPPAEPLPSPSTEEPAVPLPSLAEASPEPVTQPEQVVYPDHYSHAHPTDSEGRPLAPPTNESAETEPGQQDWVGGVAATDEPAQTPTAAAYAPPHERGT